MGPGDRAGGICWRGVPAGFLAGRCTAKTWPSLWPPAAPPGAGVAIERPGGGAIEDAL